MRRTPFARILPVLLALIALTALIGCTSAPSPSPSPLPTSAPPSGQGGETIYLAAENLAFDKKTITVPAGASATINFNNKDSGIPHNFAAYYDSSAKQSIFQGEIINGPKTITYSFKAPTQPSTYFFRCDAHPIRMTGQFIVQ